MIITDFYFLSCGRELLGLCMDFCVFRLKLHLVRFYFSSELSTKGERSVCNRTTQWNLSWRTCGRSSSRSRSSSLRAKGYLFSPGCLFTTTNEMQKQLLKSTFYLFHIKLLKSALANTGTFNINVKYYYLIIPCYRHIDLIHKLKVYSTILVFSPLSHTCPLIL